MHPLTIFIESLRTDGFQPTPHDYHRIHLALQTGGDWQITQLRDILAALLVKNPEQEIIFQQRFDAFFEKETFLKKPEQPAILPPEISPTSEKTSTQEKTSTTENVHGVTPLFWLSIFLLIMIGSYFGYERYRPKILIQPTELIFGEF